MSKRREEIKQQSFSKKELQSKIPKQYGKDDFGWLKCNTDPRKTSAVSTQQEQEIETRAWEKIRGWVEDDKCRLCGEYREIAQHVLSGCKKLARSENVKRHDNALAVLAVKWAIENGLLPEGTNWYVEKW